MCEGSQACKGFTLRDDGIDCTIGRDAEVADALLQLGLVVVREAGLFLVVRVVRHVTIDRVHDRSGNRGESLRRSK